MADSGDYADVSYLKRKFNIDDDEEDEDLTDAIESGNRYVDDVLVLHGATIPVTDAGQLESAKQMANAEAIRFMKVATRDIEVAKEWKLTRNEKTDALVKKLQSTPQTNTQSKTVVYSQDYRTEPLTTRQD